MVDAVELLFDMLTTGVPVIVKPVRLVIVNNDAPDPVTVIAPVPKAMVRVVGTVQLNDRHVSVFEPIVSVPVVSENAPANVGEPDSWRSISTLLSVHAAQVAEAVTATVPVPDEALKNTLSAAVGADAPGTPPDVADQLRMLVLSHVPVPPTQYLSAIGLLLSLMDRRGDDRNPVVKPLLSHDLKAILAQRVDLHLRQVQRVVQRVNAVGLGER